MTKIIGPVEPKKKAQLDNIQVWIDFYMYHSRYSKYWKAHVIRFVNEYEAILDGAE